MLNSLFRISNITKYVLLPLLACESNLQWLTVSTTPSTLHPFSSKTTFPSIYLSFQQRTFDSSQATTLQRPQSGPVTWCGPSTNGCFSTWPLPPTTPAIWSAKTSSFTLYVYRCTQYPFLSFSLWPNVPYSLITTIMFCPSTFPYFFHVLVLNISLFHLYPSHFCYFIWSENVNKIVSQKYIFLSPFYRFFLK